MHQSKNTILLILLLQLVTVPLFSQNPQRLLGTVIVGGVFNDSVFIVADTRIAIANISGTPKNKCSYTVAYIDSVPKIFRLNSYLIATAGSGTIGNTSIDKIIRDFNKIDAKKTDLEKTLYSFEHYIDSLYPTSKYPETKGQLFISVGYSNNKPQRVAFDRDTLKLRPSNFKSYGMISNDSRIFNYVQDKIKNSSSCNTTTELLKQSIYQLAKDIGQENCIGGPITIAKMTSPIKIIWIENNFSAKKYDSYLSLIGLIQANKLTLVPVMPDGYRIA
ncbi:MAG: hypothetical protein WAT21_13455, partial [Saprospiraceae bacterium]